MPVAAKKQLLPDTKSSRSKILSKSYPCSSAAFLSFSLRGHKRPCSAPPMHFRAAAEITPSGVPPIPKSTSAPDSGHAVEIAPATSPSEIRRIRAPASRTSEIRSECLSRSKITAVRSLTVLFLASAIC